MSFVVFCAIGILCVLIWEEDRTRTRDMAWVAMADALEAGYLGRLARQRGDVNAENIANSLFDASVRYAGNLAPDSAVRVA